MSIIDETRVATAAAAESPDPTASSDPAVPAQRRGLVFWIARYLPAEISGTAAMIVAGVGVTIWTDAPALLALAALIGEFIGFYVVLAVVIHLEQSRLGFHGRRAIARTGMLLVAEFGIAELFDTFLIRPAALVLGVWLLPDPVWGMLAGKIVADVFFYAVAAGAFTITVRTGLRRRGATAAAQTVP